MPRVIGALRESYEPWWQAGTSAATRADFAGAPARFAEATKRFHDVMRPQSLATIDAMKAYAQQAGAQLWINHDLEQNAKIPKAPAFVQ